MRYLTSSQCRAARALLKWSQPDLSKQCGVNVQTICAFESDATTPTKRTLERITNALEKGGVIFTEQGGVNPNTSDLRIFQGKSGFREFYDDIYEIARKGRHTEITLFNGISEQVLNALGKDFLQMHIIRMNEIKHKFRFRVIVEEGDKSYLGNSYCEYKCCPSDRFKNKTIYTYSSKIALIDFDDVVTVMLFNQKEFAETLLQSFDLFWDHLAIYPIDSMKKT